MDNRIRAYFLAAAGLVIAACGAIPLSTMAHFSAFDEKDFASLDRHAVRVRVSVPQGYTWDVESVGLRADITSQGRTRTDTYRLARVGEERGVRGEGLLQAGTPVTTTTLRLADSSLEPFRALQRFVAAQPAERIHLDVQLTMLSAPAGATSVKVWIEAMLVPSQGYLALVDGGTVRLNETEAFGAAR